MVLYRVHRVSKLEGQKRNARNAKRLKNAIKTSTIMETRKENIMVEMVADFMIWSFIFCVGLIPLMLIIGGIGELIYRIMEKKKWLDRYY